MRRSGNEYSTGEYICQDINEKNNPSETDEAVAAILKNLSAREIHAVTAIAQAVKVNMPMGGVDNPTRAYGLPVSGAVGLQNLEK